MRAFILLLVVLPFVYFLASGVRDAFQEPPEDSLSESEKIARSLEKMVFETPGEITVLLDNKRVDKDARVAFRTLVLKTDEEYLPRSPKIEEKAESVLKVIKKELPDLDLGEIVDGTAAYFRFLMPDSEWNIVSIKTSNGYYSRWEQRSDLYQLIREE